MKVYVLIMPEKPRECLRSERNKAKGPWEFQHGNQKEVAVARDSVVQGEHGQELKAKDGSGPTRVTFQMVEESLSICSSIRS